MDKKNKALRFRIYPDHDQKAVLAKTFGCCRFLYNRMLSDKIRQYEKDGTVLRTTPASYKKENAAVNIRDEAYRQIGA